MFCSSCSASSPKESMPSSTPSSVTSGRNLCYSWKLQIKNTSACVKANSTVVHYKPMANTIFLYVPVAQLNFLHFRYRKMWDGHFRIIESITNYILGRITYSFEVLEAMGPSTCPPATQNLRLVLCGRLGQVRKPSDLSVFVPQHLDTQLDIGTVTWDGEDDMSWWTSGWPWAGT